MNVPHRFTIHAVLEQRALVVRLSGDVEAVQGKGHDSGWSAVRDALEAAGFRVESAAVVSKEPQE